MWSFKSGEEAWEVRTLARSRDILGLRILDVCLGFFLADPCFDTLRCGARRVSTLTSGDKRRRSGEAATQEKIAQQATRQNGASCLLPRRGSAADDAAKWCVPFCWLLRLFCLSVCFSFIFAHGPNLNFYSVHRKTPSGSECLVCNPLVTRFPFPSLSHYLYRL